MARKKKTLPQKVVNVATTGMPSPVRKYLGSRFAAFLIVLAVPLVLVTGVVTVTWENGRPHLSFNRQKAAEVKQEAAEKIQELQDDHHHRDHPSIPDLIPHFTDQEKSNSGFVADWQRDESFGGKVEGLGSKVEGFGSKVVEQAEEFKDRFSQHGRQGNDFAPSTGEPENGARPATGPLSRLKQRLENRR